MNAQRARQLGTDVMRLCLTQANSHHHALALATWNLAHGNASDEVLTPYYLGIAVQAVVAEHDWSWAAEQAAERAAEQD